ncbi:Lysine histidine transporter-like 8 [Sesamum alatum]|uniref:Lysine histidine transporter-like 8 n=1 Tax=Sesamum alatum TaxID=300844 RepID=A0AAE1YGB8_9LAMI|nr:Lysine histidine transporter-like 8 [Sesamum alatum]
MEERPETELISIPATPRASTPEILTPSGQRSPRGAGKEAGSGTAKSWTPTSFISPRFLSPIGTPMKRVLINMKGYLEEVGHLTKLNPQDAWLPITESRNGNAHYAAFHNLNAGVGFQALVLPVAFSFLGCQYPGKRYNRYVELAQAAFGERLGVWLALFPTVYLSAGTATALILVGGETMKLFFQIFFRSLNALGIIAFAFRGHNLVLEIQATMPSTFKKPAHVPMWRGAKVAYVFIAMCLFPVAIGGYWAYGNLMPLEEFSTHIFAFHSHDILGGFSPCRFFLSRGSPVLVRASPVILGGLTLRSPSHTHVSSWAFSIGGIWSMVNSGLKLKFFKPN